MKLIICGSRDYADREAVFSALDKSHAKRPVAMVIHGGSGAGLLADAWAKAHDVLSARVVSGDVFACQPDGVIAFPGSPSAMTDKARAAGVKVWWPYGE